MLQNYNFKRACFSCHYLSIILDSIYIFFFTIFGHIRDNYFQNLCTIRIISFDSDNLDSQDDSRIHGSIQNI